MKRDKPPKLIDTRYDSISKHMDLRLIGVKRGADFDTWEASVRELQEFTNGAVSIWDDMEKLLGYHGDWLWCIDKAWY